MEDVVSLVSNYGFSVVLIAWMIFKDWKFNSNLESTLDSVKEALGSVEKALIQIGSRDNEVE